MPSKQPTFVVEDEMSTAVGRKGEAEIPGGAVCLDLTGWRTMMDLDTKHSAATRDNRSGPSRTQCSQPEQEAVERRSSFFIGKSKR